MHAPKLKPGNVSSKKNHISTKGMSLYFRSAIWKQHKEQTITHQVMLKSTSILASKSRSGEWFIREATQVDLNPKNMNLKDGFSLSR